MSGPWEQYQPSASQDAKPWEKYGSTVKPEPEQSMVEKIAQAGADHIARPFNNLLMGGLRGAAGIGATLQHALNPMEWGDSGADQERRGSIETGLSMMGADKLSAAYGTGKLGAEIAGTAGIGGGLGKALVKVAPVLSATPTGAKIVSALASGGFKTGGPVASTLGARAADLGIRTGAGAITGGASAALVDPEHTGAGALIGGALPGVTKLGGLAGGYVADSMQSGARRLMQSAIKPTIAQRASGDADTAIQAMLDYGINPTQGGVSKLRDLIGGLNDQVKSKIAASTATVSKQKVLGALNDVRGQFGNQVSPTSDLAAIDGTANDFLNHPNYAGDLIPVQAAQDMKQGTYKVLAKKFGQMGGAETEAQKGLARGLKEEIATAVPEVAGLNAEESRLIKTLNVAERRALLELNKNPMGLAGLAHNPLSFAATMADKSALFKSLAARMVNASSGGVRQGFPLIDSSMANNPLLRSATTNGPSLLE